MGKLDTVTVNGPEGDVIDWDAVDWRAVEDDVRRLRHRIFTATQAGDLKKVRNLQKLMLRSRANALCSVRRVTEINAGRKTAGVDGRVVLEAWEKAELATWLQRGAPGWRPKPVKRVFISKANGKQRGLGIPVIADRALQALTVGALCSVNVAFPLLARCTSNWPAVCDVTECAAESLLVTLTVAPATP